MDTPPPYLRKEPAQKKSQRARKEPAREQKCRAEAGAAAAVAAEGGIEGNAADLDPYPEAAEEKDPEAAEKELAIEIEIIDRDRDREIEKRGRIGSDTAAVERW